MQLILNLLNCLCYHDLTLIVNVFQDSFFWNAALNVKYFVKDSLFSLAQWNQLLDNYSAVVDLSAIAFAENLLACYSEVKVVLVERDIEKWYQSFNESVILNVWSLIIRTIAQLDTRFMRKLNSTSTRWTKEWIRVNSREKMQKKARRKYREHYALMKRVMSSERLLKFELDERWKSLCRFLRKSISNVKFSRMNEDAALKKKIELIAKREIKNAMMRFLKILKSVVVLALAWCLVDARIWWRHSLADVKQSHSLMSHSLAECLMQ